MKSIKQILSKLTNPINNKINALITKRINNLTLKVNDDLNKLTMLVESIDSQVEDIRYTADDAYNAVNDVDYDNMERGIRNNYNSICDIEETVSDNDAHIRELFSKLDNASYIQQVEELRAYINTISNDLRHLQHVINTNPEDAQKASDLLNSNVIFYQNMSKQCVHDELKKWSVITATQLKQSDVSS